MENEETGFRSSLLNEQLAIVTGASGGIGSAIAIALAQAGANVVVHYRSREAKAQSVVQTCRDLGVRAYSVQADLSDEAGANHLVSEASKFGEVAILVNNAGSALTKMLMDTSLADWNRALADNVTSAFLCSRDVLPGMLVRGYGRIVNVSSVWGMTGGACEAAYSAAKGGLIAFTKALAKEVASTGITVNAVAPGAIQTDMLGDLSEADMEVLRADIPMGRIGNVTEVASAVVYLSSPAAAYMTGQVLSPNGGWLT